CATRNEIDVFGCRGAARFNSQSPQQDCCAEKFDYAVDAKCLKQQTFRRPAEQERCSSFHRHPAEGDVREQQRELQILRPLAGWMTARCEVDLTSVSAFGRITGQFGI